MIEDESPPEWFTKAQRGDFKVGDRVRVIERECRNLWCSRPDLRLGRSEGNIYATMTGMFGEPALDGHEYMVTENMDTGEGMPLGYFCAAELEPLAE